MQKEFEQPGGRTDGNIILPISSFDSVTCNHIRFAQLWPTQIITKKRRDWLYRETERRMDGHIYESGRWTPTLEINTSKKSQKVL